MLKIRRVEGGRVAGRHLIADDVRGFGRLQESKGGRRSKIATVWVVMVWSD